MMGQTRSGGCDAGIGRSRGTCSTPFVTTLPLSLPFSSSGSDRSYSCSRPTRESHSTSAEQLFVIDYPKCRDRSTDYHLQKRK